MSNRFSPNRLSRNRGGAGGGPIRKPPVRIQLSDSSYSSSASSSIEFIGAKNTTNVKNMSTCSSSSFENFEKNVELSSEYDNSSVEIVSIKVNTKTDAPKNPGNNNHNTNSDSDNNNDQQIIHNSQPSSLRLLDRYKDKAKAPLASLFPASERVMNYSLFRKHIWKKSIRRKYFQLANSNEVLIGGKYSSLKLVELSNSLGIIGEIDIEQNNPPKRKWTLRIGNEKVLQIASGAGNFIQVDFEKNENSNYPYSKLVSLQGACDDLIKAFGNSRHAVKSIKNCKLCDENGKEIVAVRKTKKDLLLIDAKQNVSVIAVMAIGVFMFTNKA